ncbi:unnamed protein product [Mortierella alpina]
MTTIAPQNGPQAFCPAYINSNGSGITLLLSSAVNINSRFDSRSGQHIVLWSDISRVFEDVKYVLCGNTAVSLLDDDNFVVLAPPRIRLHAGTVLHAVMKRHSSSTQVETIPPLQERYGEAATAIPAATRVATVQTVVLAPNAPQDLSGVGGINGHAARYVRGRAPAELVNDNPFYTDIGGPINKARLVLNPQGIVYDNGDDIDCSVSVHLDETLPTSHSGTSQSTCLSSQQKHQISLASLASQIKWSIKRQPLPNTRNKTAVDAGILKAIVRLLKSSNAEIQKSALKSAFNVLELPEFTDERVQRRAAEALRNHSLSAEGRQAVVRSSAFRNRGNLLSSHDPNTRSYSIAAIKNIVKDKAQRANLSQQCSVICLEFLAEDSASGSQILVFQGLTALARTTTADHPETVLAAVGCIFNLTAHRVRPRAIISSTLVLRLGELIPEGTMLKVRLKAAGALRSLQESGEEVHELMFTSGGAGQILTGVLQAPVELQTILSESLMQLTSCTSLRQHLLEMGLLSVLIPLSGSENKAIKNNSSEAIFNLAQRAKDFEPFLRVWEDPSGGLNGFLLRSLSKQDKALQYLGLSILLELLQQRSNKELKRMIKNLPELISSSSHLRPPNNLNSKDGLYYALIAKQVIRLLK